MNSAFLQWWGDWGCKPAVAMQQEVATAIAHGGLTWIGYQMTHVRRGAGGDGRTGQDAGLCQGARAAAVGAQPVPNVAVLHSTGTSWPATRCAFW